MKLRQAQTQTQKQKLSSTLRGWLPILQSNIESLEEILEPFAEENPFIEIKSGHEARMSEPSRVPVKPSFKIYEKNSATEAIEALSISKKSLYETLCNQASPPLFPTERSQKIAHEIIEHISQSGYFEGDIGEIAEKFSVSSENIEKIRLRFAYLEPGGVGALDYKESFLFQLDDFDMSDDLYQLSKQMIENIETIEGYSKEENYEQALKIIKKFKNPPAIEFFEEQAQVIPDIFVFEIEGGIEVKLNDAYYPEVVIDCEGVDQKNSFVKQKIKDAKDLIDALEMRKATLYKIGLMVVEYQYGFFFGEAIKPMKLKDLADELERNPSTISRAISGKYLSCNRGVMPLKQFFATALDEDTSNAAIKDFIRNLVKFEDRKKPLSDNKILQSIEEKFKVKMVRRTITKYRQQMNIAGSSERKKLYILKM